MHKGTEHRPHQISLASPAAGRPASDENLCSGSIFFPEASPPCLRTSSSHPWLVQLPALSSSTKGDNGSGTGLEPAVLERGSSAPLSRRTSSAHFRGLTIQVDESVLQRNCELAPPFFDQEWRRLPGIGYVLFSTRFHSVDRPISFGAFHVLPKDLVVGCVPAHAAQVSVPKAMRRNMGLSWMRYFQWLELELAREPARAGPRASKRSSRGSPNIATGRDRGQCVAQPSSRCSAASARAMRLRHVAIAPRRLVASRGSASACHAARCLR